MSWTAASSSLATKAMPSSSTIITRSTKCCVLPMETPSSTALLMSCPQPRLLEMTQHTGNTSFRNSRSIGAFPRTISNPTCVFASMRAAYTGPPLRLFSEGSRLKTLKCASVIFPDKPSSSAFPERTLGTGHSPVERRQVNASTMGNPERVCTSLPVRSLCCHLRNTTTYAPGRSTGCRYLGAGNYLDQNHNRLDASIVCYRFISSRHYSTRPEHLRSDSSRLHRTRPPIDGGLRHRNIRAAHHAHASRGHRHCIHSAHPSVWGNRPLRRRPL